MEYRSFTTLLMPLCFVRDGSIILVHILIMKILIRINIIFYTCCRKPSLLLAAIIFQAKRAYNKEEKK
jgi:hypothetical protein